MVTKSDDKAGEISHIKEALQNCGYGEWTAFRVRPKEKQSDTADSQEIIDKRVSRFLMRRACQKS